MWSAKYGKTTKGNGDFVQDIVFTDGTEVIKKSYRVYNKDQVAAFVANELTLLEERFSAPVVLDFVEGAPVDTTIKAPVATQSDSSIWHEKYIEYRQRLLVDQHAFPDPDNKAKLKALHDELIATYQVDYYNMVL